MHPMYTVMHQPLKSQTFNDDIINVSWSPKHHQHDDSKEKYIVYTKNGLIEE